MLIAQITDLHVKAPGRLAYRHVDTAAMLSRAVEALAALDPAPDVVLVTGDLVDLGTAEEYAHLRALLAPLRTPLLPIPGNHDDRAAMAAAFADHPWLPRDGGFLHYAVEDWPVRLIGLDTVIPGVGAGRLCGERLAWLDARLAAAPDRPTVLFMHHPPFRTGIAHMDAIGLDGASELADVVRRHPQVERVVCGHVHRPVQVRFAGTVASIAPSVAHQVYLDLRGDGPDALVMEPPGFQLHLWVEGQGLVSHSVPIGSFGDPHPFFDADGRLID
jgi:Icc protein